MKTVVSKRRNPPVFVLFVLGSMAQCLGPLVHPLPATLKKEVRELEKVSLKLAKSECSLLFNGVCLSENRGMAISFPQHAVYHNQGKSISR